MPKPQPLDSQKHLSDHMPQITTLKTDSQATPSTIMSFNMAGQFGLVFGQPDNGFGKTTESDIEYQTRFRDQGRRINEAIQNDSSLGIVMLQEAPSEQEERTQLMKEVNKGGLKWQSAYKGEGHRSLLTLYDTRRYREDSKYAKDLAAVLSPRCAHGIKPLLLQDTQNNNQPILVVNVHARKDRDPQKMAELNRELSEEIAKLNKFAKKRGIKLIVGGDFNRDLQESHYKKGFGELKPHTADEPGVYSHGNNNQPKRRDGFITGQGITVEKTELMPSVNARYPQPAVGVTPHAAKSPHSAVLNLLSNPSTPVSKPSTPVSYPSTPVSKPSTPVSNPSTPVSKPSTPVSNPSTPVSKPSTPVSKPSTPVSNPSTPVSNPSTPVSNPSTPVSKPSTPVSKPSTPVKKSIIEFDPTFSVSHPTLEDIEKILSNKQVPASSPKSERTVFDETFSTATKQSEELLQYGKLMISYMAKGVLSNLDAEVEVSMAHNIRQGQTGHDKHALKLQFASQKEAILFSQKLAEECHIFSLTFPGQRKTAQNGAIYLTQDDLSKLGTLTGLASESQTGKTLYTVKSKAFEHKQQAVTTQQPENGTTSQLDKDTTPMPPPIGKH